MDDGVIRVYAAHYFDPDGVSKRIYARMIPRGRDRVGIAWWIERWDAESQGWQREHVNLFNLPPRNQLMRLVELIRTDARLLGYRVSPRTLLPYIPTVYTL